eukprot:TRINITY_DN64801_c0_g1_i1.p1 TRINITY_DN64801_c0_g1~~TRINITY_DN64801_c0_g1_i1.p1  ORF type:complete len:167 (+),score=5.88 TRINITY_DN64801_c0_g1_i1:275-775(+)
MPAFIYGYIKQWWSTAGKDDRRVLARLLLPRSLMTVLNDNAVPLRSVVRGWRTVMAEGPSQLIETLSNMDTLPLNGAVPDTWTVPRNPWDIGHWENPRLSDKEKNRVVRGKTVSCKLVSPDKARKKLRKLNNVVGQPSISIYMRPRNTVNEPVSDEELNSDSSMEQ